MDDTSSSPVSSAPSNSGGLNSGEPATTAPGDMPSLSGQEPPDALPPVGTLPAETPTPPLSETPPTSPFGAPVEPPGLSATLSPSPDEAGPGGPAASKTDWGMGEMTMSPLAGEPAGQNSPDGASEPPPVPFPSESLRPGPEAHGFLGQKAGRPLAEVAQFVLPVWSVDIDTPQHP